MLRFPAHTPADAPRESRPALEQRKRGPGKVLNIYAEMAHAPVVPAVSSAIGTAIAEHGTCDARTRETIAVAVGN